MPLTLGLEAASLEASACLLQCPAVGETSLLALSLYEQWFPAGEVRALLVCFKLKVELAAVPISLRTISGE